MKRHKHKKHAKLTSFDRDHAWQPRADFIHRLTNQSTNESSVPIHLCRIAFKRSIPSLYSLVVGGWCREEDMPHSICMTSSPFGHVPCAHTVWLSPLACVFLVSSLQFNMSTLLHAILAWNAPKSQASLRTACNSPTPLPRSLTNVSDALRRP